ncbi:phosphate ABC transporter substrate-binding/OmpA family protein [Halovulum sp. GXIMD14794]
MIFAAGSAAAGAGEVVLKARDGSAAISGELIEFKGGFYRLRTSLGELRLSADGMECEGRACPESEMLEADLVFAGTDLVGKDLLPLLLAGWASARGAEASVDDLVTPDSTMARLVGDDGFGEASGSYLIRSSDTEDGFMQLAEGEAHAAMSARRILPVEAQALRAAGAGNMVSALQERVIAADPVSVIVHPENPVGQLTLDQLADIYAGKITNWSELGGEDRPLRVLAAEEGSAQRMFFEDKVLGARRAAADITDLGSEPEIAAAVVADPDAIGYVGHIHQRNAKALPLVSACGIAAAPTAFGAKTGEYPLDRRLYLYASESGLTREMRAFLDFASGPQADAAIAKAGFVDLGVGRIEQGAVADRVHAEMVEADSYEAGAMQALLDELYRWDRLSVTLRFDAASMQLDAGDERELERLVAYLAALPEGTQVAFAGFTDDAGPFDGNRALSLRRAEQSAAALLARGAGRLDGLDISAFGFGEMAPVGCNTSAEGRRANRRVEVWIRTPGDTVVAAM